MLTATCNLRLEPDHPVVAAATPDTIGMTTLADWYERGVMLFLDEHVLALTDEGDTLTAVVRGAHGDAGYVVQLGVRGGVLDATCDCPVTQRHLVLWCKHRVAVALAARDAAGLELTRASGFLTTIPATNTPVEWTLAAARGRVRHLAVTHKLQDGTVRAPRCGQVGTYAPATTALPMCARCIDAREREQAARPD